MSHCNAVSGRDQYVAELQKHGVQVDIIGKCTKKYDGCGHSDDVPSCVEKFRTQYKFYLAFENSICSEYITEKYWKTLNANSYNIPIALGASMAEYEKYSPPNSYLHVRNFSDPAHLAEFIRRVDKDDNLFNQYHRWRETHLPVFKTTERLHCWLCRMVHERPHRKHEQYSKFWTKDMCEAKPELLRGSWHYTVQRNLRTFR